MRTRRRRPLARMLATSRRRSSAVMLSGSVVEIMARLPGAGSCLRPHWLPMPSVADAPTFVNRWKAVTQRLLAQPPRLWTLSGRNHLITRAHGSLRRGETLGENGQIGWPGGRLRLSPPANQRQRPRKARIVTPWRNWRRNRKRRRGLSTACSVNRRAAAFCNGPSTRAVQTVFVRPEIANMVHGGEITARKLQTRETRLWAL